MNLTYIISITLVLLFSYIELLVFNEEILLLLCFLSFVFFASLSLGNDVFLFFDDRSYQLYISLTEYYEMSFAKKWEMIKLLYLIKNQKNIYCLLIELMTNKILLIKPSLIRDCKQETFTHIVANLDDMILTENSISRNIVKRSINTIMVLSLINNQTKLLKLLV